ncbi:MAG: hypothetical protein J5654_10860 [Victivallales bacterium]|nr:hypothetical protein [Victivallales bacterium]
MRQLRFDFNSPEDSQVALELNERFIHRYTELLDRFSTLPGCDALIYANLKDEFPREYLEGLSTYTYLPPPGDTTGSTPGEMPDVDGADNPEELAKANEEANNIPDEELPPQLRLMRQTEQHILLTQNSVYQLLCDWCNLYAAVIPAEFRRNALQTLMLAAGLLGNMRSCLDQLGCFQFGMALQLCRRALQQGTTMLEQLQTIQQDIPGLAPLLKERLPVLQTAVQQLPDVERLLTQLIDTPQDF